MKAAAEFKNVTMVFAQKGREDFVALENLNLTLHDEQIYCLLGPSGCGKSTALNLLAGFEKPTSGEVFHGGVPVAGPGSDRGVVFQSDDSLYPWLSALDNAAFGLKMKGLPAAEREKIVTRYLEMVGLKGQAHKYPRELSGGMKQRIQLSRVLANQPRTLLMDEPFAALDAQTRRLMQDELVRILAIEKKNALFITHDIIEALVLADRIGVMRAGPRSNIREEIVIDLARPRDRTATRLIEYYRHIDRLVVEEVERSRKTA
jgi:NitT/TauT family transport system ATP-binding protein